jgi:cytochrome P450
MIDFWKTEHHKEASPTDLEIPSAREDILKLTLQVISSAGFGVGMPYVAESEPSKTGRVSIYQDGPVPPEGFEFTFRSASAYMQTNFPSILVAVGLMPSWIPRFMINPFFKTQLTVFNDMGKYLQNLASMAEEENSDIQGSDSLARLMVGSSAQTNTSKFAALTPEEVIGNLHIFTIAGHETTATTVRFTLVLLALHPEWQEWMRRGIHKALEGQPEDPHEWDYDEIFPKLVTPLCVMVGHFLKNETG